jgi:polyvinyl alcohol dehydrogenase (cytochrome)
MPSRSRRPAASLTAPFALLALVVAATATGAEISGGQQVFGIYCAACHMENPQPQGSPNEKAPTHAQLREFSADAVLSSLTFGKMQVQGSVLSDVQRRQVSEFATGKTLSAVAVTGSPNRCATTPPLANLDRGPSWNGFGNGLPSTRFQDAKAGGLTAADLPRLKLKWAFGYAAVGAARAQPTYAAGRLFVASENGEVHALDPRTGCGYWTFKAQAGVRTAPFVAQWRSGGRSGTGVYFGDGRANVYGVDAATGMLLWTRKVDDHASASITGAPVVHQGRVFVGVQGLSEEGRGSTNNYACCTFRGSLVALDAASGEVLWRTYTIDEPQPRAKNRDGVQMFGPAGGAIWSAPSVDVKRSLVYAATGNAYADPPQQMTNAVIAFDARTGKVRWHRQMTPKDAWAMGCQPTNPGNPACPEVLGPDFDFSATPIIARAGSRDVIVIPQKSGIAFALDPDREGATLWETRFAQGSGLGGQWGGAADRQNFYVGTNDYLTGNQGGLTAIDLKSGAKLWQLPPPSPLLCGEKKQGCDGGQGGAVTVIPGAVFSGAHDGGLRANSTKDGSQLWLFDANRPFQTVNGVAANGASFDGPGPVVAGGMLFVNSGYGGLVGRPGNVLLAFGLD